MNSMYYITCLKITVLSMIFSYFETVSLLMIPDFTKKGHYECLYVLYHMSENDCIVNDIFMFCECLNGHDNWLHKKVCYECF